MLHAIESPMKISAGTDFNEEILQSISRSVLEDQKRVVGGRRIIKIKHGL